MFIFLISSQIENAIALEPVTFATDWKAQAEQGGFYQAKALGLYEKAGLNSSSIVEKIEEGLKSNIIFAKSKNKLSN